MTDTIPARVTKETADLVRRIIEANPEKRYTRIQVYGMAVEAIAKKFLPRTTTNSERV